MPSTITNFLTVSTSVAKLNLVQVDQNADTNKARKFKILPRISTAVSTGKLPQKGLCPRNPAKNSISRTFWKLCGIFEISARIPHGSKAV